MIYVGNWSPFRTLSNNKLQLFNEYMILILTVGLTQFTDFCRNLAFRYNMGWMFVSVVILFLFVNVCYMLKGSLRHLKMIIIKYYRRCCHKLKTKVNEVKENLKERWDNIGGDNNNLNILEMTE